MRALPIGLMVLGLMGIGLVGVTSPATLPNEVVIGVLDFEKSGGRSVGPLEEQKKALMKELRRNTRVKLINIRESCSFSDLKKHGYEKAERYRNNYQLDMLLQTDLITGYPRSNYYVKLLDLYMKQVKEASIETAFDTPIEFRFRGISMKLLVSQDLNRVLREKKKVLAKKEVTVPKKVRKSLKEIEEKNEVLGKKEAPVPRDVSERPKEIEGFLIENGPKLIAKDEYDRVLEMIEDLPRERRGDVQIQTLGCFANLKGWVCDKDRTCKLEWWKLRQRLINSGDNGATPLLVIFLTDEDPYLRLYAAELLVHIGDKRALKDLRAAGEGDDNRKVRKYAKKAYEQISGEKF